MRISDWSSDVCSSDLHLAALGLGRLFIFPRMEILPRLHDLDIGPARFDQRIASGGNGRVLRAPELIAVGEIAVLAEQVGDDPTIVFVQWKDRGLGRYRRTAQQPRLQLLAGRRIGLLVV